MSVHVGAPNVLPWTLQDGEMCEWVNLTEATRRLKRIQAPGSGEYSGQKNPESKEWEGEEMGDGAGLGVWGAQNDLDEGRI